VKEEVKNKAVEKWEQAKWHVNNHKELYIGVAAGALIGGAGVAIVLSRPKQGAQIVQEIRQIAWRPQNRQVVVYLEERSTPSKPLHLVGSDRYFDSINDAARKTGHNPTMIAEVASGRRKSVGSDVFEFVDVSPAA
jgi:gas vesicle protein